MTASPIVLIDDPEEGYCESTGWVQTTVDENQARDLLVPFVWAEDGDSHARPVGESKRVWFYVADPGEYPEEDRWEACDQAEPGAHEFYEFDVQDAVAVVWPPA